MLVLCFVEFSVFSRRKKIAVFCVPHECGFNLYCTDFLTKSRVLIVFLDFTEQHL